MEITIYDVAKLAKVSIATVSRVINNTGNVRPNTVDRVKEAMTSLNYSPNALAQSFASQKSRTIGYISGFESIKYLSIFEESAYNGELLRGINHVAFTKGYNVLLINLMGNMDKIIVDYLDQKRVEGMIVGALPYINNQFRDILNDKRPVAYVGHNEMPNHGRHVYAQYVGYMNKVVDYFVDSGHNHIAFALGSRAINRDIFVDRSDVTLQIFEIGESIDVTRQRFTAIFNQVNRPTALYYEYIEELQPIISILNELGLKVPEDVAMISLEHKEGLGNRYMPQMTCVYVPAYEMGCQVALNLFDYLENPKGNYNEEIILEYDIIERESV